MKLIVYNGSPRGAGGNTALLVDRLLDGFLKNGENSRELAYLNRTRDLEKHVAMFQSAEAVLLAFPLYSDAMPGIVKLFIESLRPLCGRKNNPSIGFLVQSGFPEGVHCLYVARYLRKLAARLGCRYLGTIAKGGVEGINERPAKMREKLFADYTCLGARFAETGEFDPAIIEKLGKPVKFPVWIYPLFKLMMWTGIIDRYWNVQLRKNNAYDKRRARPFA